jgi:(4-(4-[2-(gamma-L-glutamylamino)ethyl]phenoxymethyl)furan-2-yl)methanamine synthase
VAKAPVIGWDLGGAHLKAARLDASGAVEQVLLTACPLWQGMHHLEAALRQAMTTLGPAPCHAVTMTGEMVDLFPDRLEGVKRIIATVGGQLSGGTLLFYAGARGFLDSEQASVTGADLASANWRASASWIATRRDAAFFVDIGSTTTDLVPIAGGRVLARESDDAGRLASGELVYTGVVRTPVMALAQTVPFAGESVPLIAELFATTADVHRVTGRLPERADLYPAADGGAKTVLGSARRLARMIGLDAESAPSVAWEQLAASLAEVQLSRISEAYERLETRESIPSDAPVIGAGVGRFLAADLATRHGRSYLEFAELLPPGAASPNAVSDSAPAVAVAALAQLHTI